VPYHSAVWDAGFPSLEAGRPAHLTHEAAHDEALAAAKVELAGDLVMAPL